MTELGIMEQVVKYLCEQSQRPNDAPDVLAMKLGALADSSPDRLIAAAPDLLEALEGLQSALSDDMFDLVVRSEYETLVAACKISRAALAKAKGQTP